MQANFRPQAHQNGSELEKIGLHLGFTKNRNSAIATFWNVAVGTGFSLRCFI
jgi:hypothetical protein